MLKPRTTLSATTAVDAPGIPEAKRVLRGHQDDLIHDARLLHQVLPVQESLYRELKHLIRLMEPLEADGTLNIPGLATLNGARAAAAKHEAL